MKLRLLRSLCAFILLLLSSNILQAQAIKLGAISCKLYSDREKLINTRFPVLGLEGREHLVIDFDLLDSEELFLSYRLRHCNADWTISSLAPVSCINGFSEYELPSPELSIGTLQSYQHYSLTLPNSNSSFLHSGNYLLEIYADDEPDVALFIIPFAVSEQLFQPEAKVLEQSVEEVRGRQQSVELSFQLPFSSTATMNQAIKPVILQNGRLDNAVYLKNPSYQQANNYAYQNYASAIFEAGNEYHKLEHLQDRGLGLGIKEQDVFEGIHRLILYPDECRAEKAYSYDMDQNGRSYLRSMMTNRVATEGGYHWVDFCYYSEELKGGSLVLEGEYFNYYPLEMRKLSYDSNLHAYRKRMLMKQGYQEYQYLFLPEALERMTSLLTEGSHYQTSNDYQALIYYRSATDQADRLIAKKQLSYPER